MRTALTLLPVLALVSCDFYPEGGKGKLAQTLVDECDPEIKAASPLLASDDGPVAPHEDTFGSSQPDPFHVHIGWPSSDPSTSISFVWRTDVGTLATAVEYGKDGELTERVEGASFLYGGAAAGEGPYRVHEIKLCGTLEPNTTYTYRVGGDGHWSKEYTFTTPGEPGSFDTFRIGLIGDSRGAYETFDDLLASMEAHSPDFYVFSGDMVELGPSQTEWDAWFDAAGDVFAEKVFVPAHGNHEFLAVHYFAQFSLPNNEEWFSVRYGDLHLVSLNDTVRQLEDRTTHQVNYMNQVFGEYESNWQMAVHHQPIYSTCTRHASDLELREFWEPVFDDFEVDFVMAGHNHIYERSVPIRAGQEVTADQGTLYMVSGGAGAPLYVESDDNWFGEVANPIEHYGMADFSPAGIDVVVRDRADNVIDSFTIPARN